MARAITPAQKKSTLAACWQVPCLAFEVALHREIQHRQNKECQQCRHHQPTDNHRRQSALHVGADAGRQRRRQHAEGRDGGRHQHGPQPLGGAGDHTLAQVHALAAHAPEVGHHDDAFWTETPNSAMKPTAVATLSVSPVTCSAIKPPSVASGTTPSISKAWRSFPNWKNSSTAISKITSPRITTRRACARRSFSNCPAHSSRTSAGLNLT